MYCNLMLQASSLRGQ